MQRRGHVLETMKRSISTSSAFRKRCEHGQMAFLREGLGDHVAVGEGREGGERGEYAAIFYRTDRFKELGRGNFWLSETPEEVASVGWDAALTRMVTWVELEDRVSGRALRVWCTHFDRGKVARLARSSWRAGRGLRAPDLAVETSPRGSPRPCSQRSPRRGYGIRPGTRIPARRRSGPPADGWAGPAARRSIVLADDGFEKGEHRSPAVRRARSKRSLPRPRRPLS